MHEILFPSPFGTPPSPELVARARLVPVPEGFTGRAGVLVFEDEANLSTFRQRAQNFLKFTRSDGYRTIAITVCPLGAGGDLYLDIGSQKGQQIALFFEQYIRKNRQRMAFFDNAGNRL